MHADNPSWINPALEVIRKTDPATYARMQASPWHVHVISSGDEQSLRDYAEKYGPYELMATISVLSDSFGVTQHSDDGIPLQLTFINKPGVEGEAGEMSVPVADFLADVLVHEFRHDEGDYDEKSTFAVSTAFAMKLGARDHAIAELSRAIGNES